MKSFKLDDYLVRDTSNLGDAVRMLNAVPYKFLIVVDIDNRLIGTLTDGDIRRGLVKNVQMNIRITSVCYLTPRKVLYNQSYDSKVKMLLDTGVTFLPEIDKDNKVVGVFLKGKKNVSEPKNNPVVLMAGGLGSRLGELTQTCPKPLLKIGSKPILEHIIENLKFHGFRHVYITINYLGEKIQEYFKDGSEFGMKIEYVKEQRRLGTAGSLFYLKDKIKSSFLLMNADIYSSINLGALLEHHLESTSYITSCTRKHTIKVPYGVIESDCNGRAVSITEKPSYTYDVGAGVYMLDASFLKRFENEEYVDMPDMIENSIKKGLKVTLFPLHETWHDIGQVEEYQRVQEIHKENDD